MNETAILSSASSMYPEPSMSSERKSLSFAFQSFGMPSSMRASWNCTRLISPPVACPFSRSTSTRWAAARALRECTESSASSTALRSASTSSEGSAPTSSGWTTPIEFVRTSLPVVTVPASSILRPGGGAIPMKWLASTLCSAFCHRALEELRASAAAPPSCTMASSRFSCSCASPARFSRSLACWMLRLIACATKLARILCSAVAVCWNLQCAAFALARASPRGSAGFFSRVESRNDGRRDGRRSGALRSAFSVFSELACRTSVSSFVSWRGSDGSGGARISCCVIGLGRRAPP